MQERVARALEPRAVNCGADRVAAKALAGTAVVNKAVSGSAGAAVRCQALRFFHSK